ncbi:MAG: tetratricopeptide repeat protein [Candidatus Melainabacteria bacterium]|nr:tetratricopeptide repeat protein [Candidatus Melainabacteria bacterium]
MIRWSSLSFGNKLAVSALAVVCLNLIAMVTLWFTIGGEDYLEDFKDAIAYVPGEDWEASRERRVKDASKAIDKNPRDARAYAKRGEAYSSLERYEDALSDLDRAIELGRRKARLYALRASVESNLERDEDALRDYSQAIALEPGNAEYYDNRAGFYAGRDELDRALADYDRAIELSSSPHRSYYYRAGVLRRMGERERALSDLDSVINGKANGYEGESYEMKVAILVEDSKDAEALRVCDAWIKDRPDDYLARLSRADIYARQNRSQEEKPDLEAAVRILGKKIEEDHYAYYLAIRGNLFNRLGKGESAKKDWREALALYLDDDSGEPYFGSMYDLCRKVGDSKLTKSVFEKEIAFWRKRVEADPSDASAHAGLIRCLLASGNSDEAVQAGSAGIRVCSSSGELYFLRGRAERNRGSEEAALKDLARARDLGFSEDVFPDADR